MSTNLEVLKNLVKGFHKCEEQTCGCLCGTTYDAQGKPVVCQYGQFSPLCIHISNRFDAGKKSS